MVGRGHFGLLLIPSAVNGADAAMVPASSQKRPRPLPRPRPGLGSLAPGGCC